MQNENNQDGDLFARIRDLYLKVDDERVLKLVNRLFAALTERLSRNQVEIILNLIIARESDIIAMRLTDREDNLINAVAEYASRINKGE